jgi:hypothetical protein
MHQESGLRQKVNAAASRRLGLVYQFLTFTKTLRSVGSSIWRMTEFAPLTPELRARLAPGASREFLRRMEGRAGLGEADIEAAMSTAPNEKAMERAARRLRGKPGVVEVATWRDGSTWRLTVVDRYATGVDRARPDASGGAVRLFETAALAFRTTLLSFRRRCWPLRDVVDSVNSVRPESWKFTSGQKEVRSAAGSNSKDFQSPFGAPTTTSAVS